MLANHRSHAPTKSVAKRGSSTVCPNESSKKKTVKSSDVVKEEDNSTSRKVSETSKTKKLKVTPYGEMRTSVPGKTKDRLHTAVGGPVAKDNKTSTPGSSSLDTKRNSKASGTSASSAVAVLPVSGAETVLPKEKLSKKKLETTGSSQGATVTEERGQSVTPNLPPFAIRSPVSRSHPLHENPSVSPSVTDRDKRTTQGHSSGVDNRLPYIHTGKGTSNSSTREEENAYVDADDDDEEEEEEDDDEDDEEEEDGWDEEDGDEEDESEEDEEETDEEEDDSDVSDGGSELGRRRGRRGQSSKITVKVSREDDRNVKVLYIGKYARLSRFKKDIMRRFSYEKLSDFDMYCIDAAGDHVDIDVPKDFKKLTQKFWKAIEKEKLALEEAHKASQLQPQSNQAQCASKRHSSREAAHGSTPLMPINDPSRTAVDYGDRSSSTVLRLYVRDSYKARLEAKKRDAYFDTPSLGNTKVAGDIPLTSMTLADSNESTSRQGNHSSHFNMDTSRSLAKTINFREDEEVIWTKMALLGKGSFGSVYEGITSEGTIMAVKVLEVPLNEESEELQSVKREINLMRSLKHKNIVAYYGCQTKELSNGQRQLEIFIEHCHGGSLTHLRRKFERAKERFAISLVRAYTRQILEGLNYLHSMNVVHRDLKSDNVLISALGEAKLADFGCSRRIGTALRDSAGGMGNEGFQTMVGTPLFMAPEVLSEKEGGYSKPADVWSVGCLLLELLGRTPWTFSGNTNVFQIMFHISKSRGMPTGVPKTCPKSLYSFFERCFAHEQAKRASAAELLKHEWITCPDSKLEEVPDDEM